MLWEGSLGCSWNWWTTEFSTLFNCVGVGWDFYAGNEKDVRPKYVAIPSFPLLHSVDALLLDALHVDISVAVLMQHILDMCILSALDRNLGFVRLDPHSNLGSNLRLPTDQFGESLLLALVAKVGVSQLHEQLMTFQKSIQGQMSVIVDWVASLHWLTGCHLDSGQTLGLVVGLPLLEHTHTTSVHHPYTTQPCLSALAFQQLYCLDPSTSGPPTLIGTLKEVFPWVCVVQTWVIQRLWKLIFVGTYAIALSQLKEFHILW